MLVLLAVLVASGVGMGFWLGVRKGDLDVEYLESLEVRARALEGRVDSLTRDLADARLTRNVDAQAAQSLRETIAELRDQQAGLREEVTFYKSLMAPSSIERGLQIAELELGRGEADNQFTYHLLLTQAEERRDWVQGNVTLDVQGVRARLDGSSAEEVLPLTDLTDVDPYPMKFRFRYFQNFRGTVTLPEGFRPQSVRVTVVPRGRSGDRDERSFDWIVDAG